LINAENGEFQKCPRRVICRGNLAPIEGLPTDPYKANHCRPSGRRSWEREIMLERQREGIAKAKADGKYKGRKPTVAVQAVQIRALRAAGEKPAHIARRLGVARSSIYRMLENAPDGSNGSSGAMAAETTAYRISGTAEGL
jgi:hypothetical protein